MIMYYKGSARYQFFHNTKQTFMKTTVKPVLSGHSKADKKIGFQDR